MRKFAQWNIQGTEIFHNRNHHFLLCLLDNIKNVFLRVVCPDLDSNFNNGYFQFAVVILSFAVKSKADMFGGFVFFFFLFHSIWIGSFEGYICM